VVMDTPTGRLLAHYESLRELDLELPAHLEAAYRLQQRGFNFSGEDLSMAGVARQIAQQLQGEE